MITIRRFESADAEAVSSIIRYTMRVSNGADYPLDRLQALIDYFSPGKVLQLSQERVCLVAEVNRKVVGTVALEAAELSTFFVLPDYQYRGIGSLLLEGIEDAAIAGGVEIIRVESSITGTGFYEKKGYIRTGKEKDGVAGRQIEMEKRVT